MECYLIAIIIFTYFGYKYYVVLTLVHSGIGIATMRSRKYLFHHRYVLFSKLKTSHCWAKESPSSSNHCFVLCDF